MDAFDETVALLLGKGGCFQNGTIAKRLGISKQRVTVRLRKMVERGELRLQGRGRAAWYLAGPAYRDQDQETTGRPFWDRLAEGDERFGYVLLVAHGRTHLRTRDEAARVIRQVNRQLIVVDFAGVETATRAFLEALFDLDHARRDHVEAINAPPDLQSVIVSVKAEVHRTRPKRPLLPPEPVYEDELDDSGNPVQDHTAHNHDLIARYFPDLRKKED